MDNSGAAVHFLNADSQKIFKSIGGRIMDNFENEREKRLIEEREEYEKAYFSQIIDDMMQSSALDKLISDRFQYFDDKFDFDPSEEYLYLEELYSDEHYTEDESNDYDEMVSEQINNYDPTDFYDDVLDDVLKDENDEDYLKGLIEEHVTDEKAFLDSMLIEVIQEEHYFEKAIDDLIIEQIPEPLEPDFEYYEMDYEPYWYDSPFDHHNGYWPDEDESVIDPFDSFDEIDYPVGEPKHVYPEINNYDSEMREDFERYQRRKEYLFGYGDDELPDPDDDLILDVPDEYLEVENDDADKNKEFLENEMIEEKRNQELIKNQEKIESLYKNYLTKDDTLDNMIKEKLKEKKFNV